MYPFILAEHNGYVPPQSMSFLRLGAESQGNLPKVARTALSPSDP